MIERDTWQQLFQQTFDLILLELLEIQEKPESAPTRYPKMIVAVEYFRLLRGEAFHSQRPPLVTLADGKTPYQLEDELSSQLEKVKALVDFSEGKARYFLNETGRLFAPPEK